MVTITVTGITGGLNSSIITYLSKWASSSSSNINLVGTTRTPTNLSPTLKSSLPNVTILAADFDKPSTLTSAFTGTDILLVISTNTKDTTIRSQQHRHAIDAAVAAKVPWVIYTSLAFGHGYATESKISVMQAHLVTEQYIKEQHSLGKLSRYTIVREGVYADAFPLFLNWFPDTTTITVPGNGCIAWAVREELAEANARLLWLLAETFNSADEGKVSSVQDKYSNKTILLSGPKAYNIGETAGLIEKYTGNKIEFRIVSEEEYVKEVMGQGKSEFLARFWATLYNGLAEGEGGVVSETLEELLGRRPTDVDEFIKGVVGREGGYRWHQQG